MDLIQIGTLAISVGSLLLLIVKFIVDNRNRDKDRIIGVMVSEQREKKKKLFEHIVEILHAESKFIFSDVKSGKVSPVHLESIKHCVGVITNINSKNKHGNDLRNECVELTYWFSGTSNSRMKENESDYIEIRNQAVANIWIIIENYNKEEEKLIEEMINKKSFPRMKRLFRATDKLRKYSAG